MIYVCWVKEHVYLVLYNGWSWGDAFSYMWGQTEPNCLVIGPFSFWKFPHLKALPYTTTLKKKKKQQSLRFGLTPVIGEMIGIDSVKDYEDHDYVDTWLLARSNCQC
jgi:hypothetical protein